MQHSTHVLSRLLLASACALPAMAEDEATVQVLTLADAQAAHRGTDSKYTAQGFRYTMWLDEWANSEAQGIIDIDDRLHGITEFGWESDKGWGIDLGLVWSLDTDDLIEDALGSIHGNGLQLKFELASTTGKLNHRSDVISDTSIDEFDLPYRYIGIGMDTERLFGTGGINATLGLAYVQWNTPSISQMSGGDVAGIEQLLDPDTEYWAMGAWVNFDTLRNEMRGLQPFGAWPISGNQHSKTGVGLDMEVIMGIGSGEVSGDAQRYLKDASGATTIKGEDALGFYYGITFRTHLYHVRHFGDSIVGLSVGIEGRGHQLMDLEEFTPSASGSGTITLYNTTGAQRFFWGPYATLATFW